MIIDNLDEYDYIKHLINYIQILDHGTVSVLLKYYSLIMIN